MNSADAKLDLIRISILEEFPEARIILFGSRVNNTAGPASDYDLLVVLNSRIIQKQRLICQAHLRKKLAVLNILADIIIQSRFDVEKKTKLPGHIVRTAVLEGIEL